MKFGEVPLQEAAGAYLAHSLKTPFGRLKKGRLLSAELLSQLQESGFKVVTVARLEPGDVFENEAALLLARALAGSGVQVGTARTGRVNLHALADGVCEFERALIDRINGVDEGITVATVEPSSAVGRGRLLATVKIIPYAVTRHALDTVLGGLDGQMQLHERRNHQAVLVQTRLPTLSEAALDKTVNVTRQRLLGHHAALLAEHRTEHTVAAVVETLTTALQSEADWVLLAGASAIADREDVIPSAIRQLGGDVHHFGMPMDPGNLLLIATMGKTWVIGMPGCARSPRANGLDRVLERLACELPIHRRWLASLGVGGLLHEIVDRPEPRVSPMAQPAVLTVAALVMAAGSSTRFGAPNKLLAEQGESSVLAKVLTSVQQSQVSEALLVSGHEANRIARLCDDYWRCDEPALTQVHNPLYASGMASSLVCGIAELSARGVDGALVCLGDMPAVSREVMDALVDAFRQDPSYALYIPTIAGQRGNPVLIAASLFDSVLMLEGDVGARVLAKTFPNSVMEVPVLNPGILLDIDTPADLQHR